MPEGSYNIDLEAEGTYEIGLSNNDVPVSRGIKMHSGNFGLNTEGCWLPTPGRADRAGAGGSSALFNDTIKPTIQNAGGGTLTITDDPNMVWKPDE